MSVVSLGVAALGWVASPIVKDLVDRSITYLGSDIAKGLEDLEMTLIPEFQLTIQAAQNSPHADHLNKWLARLKNAYYDAEAILHDLEYDHLRRQIEGAEKIKKQKKILVCISSHPMIKPLAKLSRKVSKKVNLLSPQKKKLWQSLKKLKEVAAEAKTFRDLLRIQTGHENDTLASASHLVTTAYNLVDRVFGRDTVRDQIIDFLLKEQEASSSTSNRHLIVAITGVGGDGKTTLAQYVYNNKTVREYFGVRRMWLSISHQNNIDIKERTKEMIECLSGKECPNLRNETGLQAKLIETLSDSKPILLVIDDVRYDGDQSIAEQWDTLLAPFRSLGGNFKIIITSRSNCFPHALNPGKHIPIEHLAFDDFENLFMHHALHGLENKNNLNELRDIGNQIAKKMTRSPLVAKVVGNQLREHSNTSFWIATLQNVNVSDTIKVLQWSYERLDAQLQRCFLFCAGVPKDSNRFITFEMVQYWVALDLIQHSNTPSDDNRSVEDIGLEYFNKMVVNSIFQLVDGWYTMHDLFHDLAEKLSVGDCFRLTDSEKAIPKDTVQHMFLRVNNENLQEKLCSLPEVRNLRTLIIGNPHIEDEDMREIFSIISTKFKNLRILEIWSHGYKALPTTVGDLRNLRCLKVYMSSLEELPDSISQLYHLQFLGLPESVKTFPIKLSNLIKLRSIEKYEYMKSNYVYILPPIPHLGKLSSLQHLPEFHVRKVEGYEVGQLGNLREIRGSLRIVDLENVKDGDEAALARLTDKPKLDRLELMWGDSGESDSQVDVIEALQPTENLQWLTIDGYSGSSYPTWLQEHSFLKYIKHVSFRNCNALSSLPQNFHQFRYCSTLFLENLSALMKLSTLPENLTTIRIIKCPSLILASDNELPIDVKQLGAIMERVLLGVTFLSEFTKTLLDHEFKSFEQTGSLQNCSEQLRIIQIAHLQVDGPPELLPNIIPAWLICHQQRMDFICSDSSRANKLKLPLPLSILDLGYCCISNGALSNCLGGLVALEELHLECIMTITTLPPAHVLQSLESLRLLRIRDCWCLRSLGGLHALPRLKEFQVNGCFLLETRGASPPPSVQSFIIKGCTLHGDILGGNLPCLQNVSVITCNTPRFLSLSQLTLLKSLVLFNCSHLFFIRGLQERPFIDTLIILQLPNLIVESVVQCFRGCRQLEISSSVMLRKLLSSQDFLPPKILWMNHCQEEAITFEKSDHLRSIKILGFMKCNTKNLPTSLSDFSALEKMIFNDCPEISELPILPNSVQYIKIRGCPVLKGRCQPTGRDRHKIQHIQHRWIE